MTRIKAATFLAATLAAWLFLVGCRTIVYTSPDGRKLEYYSFGNDTKVDALDLSTEQGAVKLGGLDSSSKAMDLAGKALDVAAKAAP